MYKCPLVVMSITEKQIIGCQKLVTVMTALDVCSGHNYFVYTPRKILKNRAQCAVVI